MKIQTTTYQKIGVVYGLLVILLVIALFVRFWQGNNLKNQAAKSTTTNTQKSTSKPGKLSLSTSTNTYKAGDKIEAGVYFEAPNIQLDGSDIILRFDPGILNAIDLIPGTYFRLMPRKDTDNKSGIVKITALDSGGNAAIAGRTLLATVRFTAQKPGSTAVNFDFTEGGTNKTTLIEHKTSQNILGEAKGITIRVMQ